MSQPLAGAIQQVAAANSNLRVGIVQAIDSASAITVNIGGGIISDMPFLASYSPAVGDNVSIARFDATWIALGIVGDPSLTVVRGTVSSSVTAFTSVGTTEMDLPFLASQENVKVSAGHIYELFVRCVTQQSVAADEFQWRCRRDAPAPTSPGQEIGFQRFSNRTVTGSWSEQMQGPYEAVADESFPIFWSLVRVTGSGTITATPTAGTTRAYMKVVDLGLNTGVSGSPWSVTT